MTPRFPMAARPRRGRAAPRRALSALFRPALALVTGALPLLSIASLSLAPAVAQAGAPTGPAASTPAPVTFTAEVMVLHGSNAGGGIDNRVGSLAQLKKPPFSAYDTYKLLTQSRTPLVPGAATPVTLPDGGKVSLTLKQTITPGRRKMAVTIHKPDGSVFLPLAEVTTGTNESFFVAGYRHKNGILVIGIKLVG